MAAKKQRELDLDFFKKQGSIGGKKGGALAWEGLTAEERSARATRASHSRKWRPAKAVTEAAAAAAAPKRGKKKA